MSAPTLSRVHSVLHYSVITGVFTWIEKPSPRTNVHIGDIAGSVGARGCIYISLDRKRHFAHRLAWFYLTGEWPADEIDHVNGMTAQNHWLNLREATRRVNQQNIRRRKNGRPNDLPQGVTFTKAHKTKPYAAQIGDGGRTLHIGYFADPAEAHQAYLNEKRVRHEGCTL